MKIIGLMPVKNEAWILPTTIPHLQQFVDEILVLDTGSTDGSQELLSKFGVETKAGLYCSTHQNNYSSWRNVLLDWGRKRNGTHFVWLDADEAFSSQLLPSFRSYLAQLRPGQKMLLDWLCLWKSPYHLRTDSCIWKKITKDFIVCDDGVSCFCESLSRHEGRTPGSTDLRGQLALPREKGSVLHFQFVPFQRFQMKQAFQRVREFWEGAVEQGHDCKQAALPINRNYAITLDSPKARCTPMPLTWYVGMAGLEHLQHAPAGWYQDAILEFFARKSIAWFEPLQIWHIPCLREEFVKQTGREPMSQEIPAFLKMKSYIHNNIVRPMISALQLVGRQIQ